MRGKFIVVEGPDGVGTTTQTKALVARLSTTGRAHATAEPSGGPIGRLVREALGRRDRGDDAYHRSLALLFAADRLEHVHGEIEPLLAQGVHVVSDRYLLSSLVYQGLSCPLDWIVELNKHAPPPDAVVVVSVPLDEALRRQDARGGPAEVFDGESVQARVHRRYAELAPFVGGIPVDGRGPVDEVTDRVVAALRAAGAWP